MEKKPRWNRAAVLTVAGELADHAGLGALTLTSLAQTLGLRPPSLFNHVESLADLIRGLALVALEELATRIENAVTVPGTPEVALTAMMEAYRNYVREHPGLYAATLAFPATQTTRDPEWALLDRRIMDTGLGLAGKFGLQGAEGIHALRGWRAFAHGFSDLERQRGFGIPLDTDDSYRRGVQALTPPPKGG